MYGDRRLNTPLLPLALRYLAPPGLVLAVALAISARTRNPHDLHARPSRNPLQVSAALQMAAIFQLVLILVYAVQATSGPSGILTTAAVVGLTDVDALTLSIARGVASLDTAALAIAVGVLSYTVLKALVAGAFGNRRFAAIVAGALGASALAAIATISLL